MAEAKDREAAANGAAIRISVPDVRGGWGPNDQESIDYRRGLETEFGQHFEFTSIGHGAAQGAYFTLVGLATWPYLATALALFFQGKRINENLDAWHEIYKKISAFFKRDPTLDRSGAAILALKKITDALGHEPQSIQLIGYRRMTWFDKQEGKEDPGYLTEIEPAPDRVTSISIYVFEIDAEDRHFRAFVEGHDVRLIEVEPPNRRAQ